MRMRLELRLMLVAAALTAGCSQRTESAVPQPGRDKENMMTNEAASGAPVANLPSSFGRNFATLDEYLAHLERYAGPVGRAWYRKVGPDAYELVTTVVPRPQLRIYTREELMRQYGFTR
jgi:hypothetical protein